MPNMKLYPIYQVDVLREQSKEKFITENEADAVNCARYWMDEKDVIEVNIRGRLKRKDE